MKDSTYFEENFANACGLFQTNWLLDTEIRYDFVFLCTIAYLCKSGVCTATNKWFSKKLQYGNTEVSKKIAKLQRLGYINVLYEKKGNNIEKRYITLNKF